MTARVSACSIDPGTGTPSQTGWLEIQLPEGGKGYLCATGWDAQDGFWFSNDRLQLLSDGSACCDGSPGEPIAQQQADDSFGPAHGPTHIKPQEMVAPTGGELRQNPFAVVVSGPTSAARFQEQLALWKSWSGDGQPHPGPDGTGSYWFPEWLDVNYVLIPSMGGDPVIVLAPEPSMDPELETPLGHPTMGACREHGGAPLAFIAGDLRDGVLTNGSGRFGFESTVSPEVLANTAKLFNCYGIPVTEVVYSPPE